MLDDAAILLLRARQESRDIFKRDQRDIKRVAETHEARAFDRSIDIERTRQHRRLVGHHAHAASIQAGKADQNIFRVMLVDFKEIAVIHDCAQHVFHVVRLVRFGGDNRIQFFLGTVGSVGFPTPEPAYASVHALPIVMLV